MRNSIISAYLLLGMFFSLKQYGQIEKGTKVPGILVSGFFDSSPYKDTSVASTRVNSYFRTSLGYGMFIKDNLMLNVNVFYTRQGTRQTSEPNLQPSYNYTYKTTDNTNTLGIGLGISQYKFVAENFGFNYGLNVSGSFGEGYGRSYLHDVTFNPVTGTYNRSDEVDVVYHNRALMQGALAGGLFYFVTRNLALNASMGFVNVQYGYSPYDAQHHIEAHNTAITFSPGFNNFGVGATYYIRPATKDQSSK